MHGNKIVPRTRFFVTLEDFSAFLCIKAVWGIEEKQGYELETVLNSTFYYKLLNALGFAASLVEEHPMKSQQPIHDSSSGAKVDIISHISQNSIINFTPSLLPHYSPKIVSDRK